MTTSVVSGETIYIAAPAGGFSGGPELLHQLAHKLRGRELNAVMYYFPRISCPVHPSFAHYQIPYVFELDDRPENVLIVPETMTSLFSHSPLVQKAVWWLSFDNYFLANLGFGRMKDFLLAHNLGSTISKLSWFRAPKADLHMVQSVYARKMLQQRGVQNVVSLSDYLHHSFLAQKVDLNKKCNVVAYNPAKGKYLTTRLIRHCIDLEFVPIADMGRDEVVGVLKEAKVYVDFGSHPGKDRFPREAAALHCCVITNRRGSAGIDEDVPISYEYKFDDTLFSFDPESVRRVINACFRDYDPHNRKFDSYRAYIAAQEGVFEAEIDVIFGSRL